MPIFKYGNQIEFFKNFKLYSSNYFESIVLNRITIMIDSELQKKLREKQARMIKQESKSVSFSRVINETLEECFKKKK